MTKLVQLPNGRHWLSQGEAMSHFKAMLGRCALGERVVDIQDHSDLEALLIVYDGALKPGQDCKIGTGVSFFSKQRNRGPGWVTDGFHVHRLDGTQIDFSYIDAVRAATR